MAFDFERYLRVYQPDNSEFYSNLSTVTPAWDSKDDMPAMTKAVTISDQTMTSHCLISADDGHFPPFIDALDERLEVPTTSKGLHMITSRFRSSQDFVRKYTRTKIALYKQNSLPASFGSCSSAKTKTDSTRRRRNSVKFADEVGENLTTFLMIPSRFEDAEHEKEIAFSGVCHTSVIENKNSSTSTPENNVCHSLEGSQCITPPDFRHETPKPDHETPIFQLCFDQPAADFEQFREKLAQQFICLENVKVDVKSHPDGTSNGFVNHGTVLCTIKVRNLHPVKRVFARCTDNNWRTHADIFAVYVGDGTSGNNEYDTFAFALRNPFVHLGNGESRTSDLDSYSRKTASVEFALCYEVPGSTYWDNNDGQNYKVVWI